ncbi:MAG: GNAT family N-acetyltransferase [Deltaproteobacteria bacterium]|nr:GNAT family N-acetyltransferase [Deltaproteobacteria bacterium]
MDQPLRASARLLHRGRDLLRRRGVFGLAARVVQRPLHRVSGFELDLVMAGPIGSVRQHLDARKAKLPAGTTCRCVTDRAEFPALRIAVDRLNPGNTFHFPDGEFRVAVAERNRDLLAYWGFLRQGATLEGSGLFVHPDWRGRRLPAHLLAAVLSAGCDGIRTVSDWTDLFNRASIRAMRRCGLSPAGVILQLACPGLGCRRWSFPLRAGMGT